MDSDSDTVPPISGDAFFCPQPGGRVRAEREQRAYRILMVDDGGVLARTIRSRLEKSGYDVLIAKEAQRALQMLRRERPDIVLVDLMLPNVDGTDVTGDTEVEMGLLAMPVITLTACPDQIATHRPGDADLDMDIDQSETTRFDPSLVVACIQHLLHRVQREATPPVVIRAGALALDLARNRVEINRKTVHLTHTEFSLLRALAEQPGHALTRSEMIKHGLDSSYEGMERTVDSHIKNLRRKLNDACGAACVIETVFGIGYRLADGELV